ncbi:MAG: NAD(P)H-binding protein [Sphingomonadaceae bacterium]|nr:NAD(P)H-binding protein [Sphingomonadaceae bacterium]
MILAVTGGTGFVGSHLLPLAVAQGYSVRALARRPQPPQPGVAWIAGDLAEPGALCEGVDAVVHIAGTINARDRAGFDAGNVAGTASIVAAARAAGVRRFVHVSSLAAREPGLSDYGASKAAAEDVMRTAGLDAAIVRPPGVYGPGDRETLPVFQMVARGLAVLPGPGRFSLIEVGDLAAVLLRVAASDRHGLAEVDDGHGGYSHAELALAIGDALGRRPRLLPLSTGVLRLGAGVATAVAKLRREMPKLSRDRARYLAHPDWTADPTLALPSAIRGEAVPLADGLARTVAWYRAQGWLAPARL